MAATGKGRAVAPARTSTPKPPAPADSDPDTTADLIMTIPGFEPLVLSTSAPEPLDQRRVRLFQIDGEWHTIPYEIPMNVGLTYMAMIASGDPTRQVGATDYVLREVLGDDGYTALLAYKHLRREHFEQILAIIMRLVLGTLEPPKES